MTERHMHHKETLSNGCKIEVKAEILRDGSLGMFIGVYRPDGTAIEEDHDPSPHLLDMEAALTGESKLPRASATVKERCKARFWTPS